jgi:YfiH family protein
VTITPAWLSDPQQWVLPDWSAPASVRACVSTRLGPGVSVAPLDRFNLGSRCGDAPAAVSANRAALVQALRLPTNPAWLHQVHGPDVATIMANREPGEPYADAAVTRSRGTVLAILTADCLPILFTSNDGAEIAASHAGWRGLCAGVIEKTVAAMTTSPANIIAWLGPAIGPQVYEVDVLVRDAFLAENIDAVAAFHPVRTGHWLCDLYVLARQRLQRLGITQISGGDLCSYSDAQRFYSYRRDHGNSGRMASLIWLE